MKFNSTKGIYLCIIITLVSCFMIVVGAISRYGSTGDEVRAIQTRLRAWHYYHGNVDGIYGWATVDAVKAFQRKNGLTADGIAGPATLMKIGLPTGETGAIPASTVVNNVANTNVDLLARLINGESRGEPYDGQVAVGAVVLNRVKHPSFPNTIAGVIYQPGAFTAINDGQINAQMYESCVRAARDAMNGWDASGGSIYYYNPVTANNVWIRSRPVVKTIGRHIFAK